MPTVEQARYWLRRWDLQQETYLPDREERFAVIADVVEAIAERPDPLVVDLGVGPGSLSGRLAARLPAARIVGVDADPLLLGLAQVGYDDVPGMRLVSHDLRDAGWLGALGLDRAPDAFVSTTALHWLTRGQLRSVYATCVRALRPGGVLVNGDHMSEAQTRPGLDALTRLVARRRADRVGRCGDEDWQAWWDAVEIAPELADLLAARATNATAHATSGVPDLDDHLAALRHAGFAEVGTVWQHGDDRVLVAVR